MKTTRQVDVGRAIVIFTMKGRVYSHNNIPPVSVIDFEDTSSGRLAWHIFNKMTPGQRRLAGFTGPIKPGTLLCLSPGIKFKQFGGSAQEAQTEDIPLKFKKWWYGDLDWKINLKDFTAGLKELLRDEGFINYKGKEYPIANIENMEIIRSPRYVEVEADMCGSAPPPTGERK